MLNIKMYVSNNPAIVRAALVDQNGHGTVFESADVFRVYSSRAKKEQAEAGVYAGTNMLETNELDGLEQVPLKTFEDYSDQHDLEASSVTKWLRRMADYADAGGPVKLEEPAAI